MTVLRVCSLGQRVIDEKLDIFIEYIVHCELVEYVKNKSVFVSCKSDVVMSHIPPTCPTFRPRRFVFSPVIMWNSVDSKNVFDWYILS